VSVFFHAVSETHLNVEGLFRKRRLLFVEIYPLDWTVVFTVRLHVMQRTVLQRPFCPSVYLTNAWFVTKRKKVVLTFLYHM